MYRNKLLKRSNMRVNESYEGETLETKIQRLVKNKEPLDGTIPLTYTERKDGVRPEMNVRTDKWEIAAEAMDHVTASKLAKRQERLKPKEDGGAEPVGGNQAA